MVLPRAKSRHTPTQLVPSAKRGTQGFAVTKQALSQQNYCTNPHPVLGKPEFALPMLQRAIWAAKKETNEHIKRLIKVWTTKILTLYFWQQDCYNGKILEQLLWLLCRDKDRVMKIHFFSYIRVLEIKDQDGISNSPAAQYCWAKPWLNLDSSLTLCRNH